MYYKTCKATVYKIFMMKKLWVSDPKYLSSGQKLKLAYRFYQLSHLQSMLTKSNLFAQYSPFDLSSNWLFQVTNK